MSDNDTQTPQQTSAGHQLSSPSDSPRRTDRSPQRSNGRPPLDTQGTTAKIMAAIQASPIIAPRLLAAAGRNASVVLVTSTFGLPMVSLVSDLDRILGLAERSSSRGFDPVKLHKKNALQMEVSALLKQLADKAAEAADVYDVNDLRDTTIKKSLALFQYNKALEKQLDGENLAAVERLHVAIAAHSLAGDELASKLAQQYETARSAQLEIVARQRAAQQRASKQHSPEVV